MCVCVCVWCVKTRQHFTVINLSSFLIYHTSLFCKKCRLDYGIFVIHFANQIHEGKPIQSTFHKEEVFMKRASIITILVNHSHSYPNGLKRLLEEKKVARKIITLMNFLDMMMTIFHCNYSVITITNYNLVHFFNFLSNTGKNEHNNKTVYGKKKKNCRWKNEQNQHRIILILFLEQVFSVSGKIFKLSLTNRKKKKKNIILILGRHLNHFNIRTIFSHSKPENPHSFQIP